MVSTPLRNVSQNGNLPQVRVKIKNIWNHHPEILYKFSKNLHPRRFNKEQTKPILRGISKECRSRPRWWSPAPAKDPAVLSTFLGELLFIGDGLGKVNVLYKTCSLGIFWALGDMQQIQFSGTHQCPVDIAMDIPLNYFESIRWTVFRVDCLVCHSRFWPHTFKPKG